MRHIQPVAAPPGELVPPVPGKEQCCHSRVALAAIASRLLDWVGHELHWNIIREIEAACTISSAAQRFPILVSAALSLLRRTAHQFHLELALNQRFFRRSTPDEKSTLNTLASLLNVDPGAYDSDQW